MPQEIYFHVGLGKTASTYLQKKVFPRLQGIHYIPPEKYRRYAKYIDTYPDENILISREMDRQLARECRRFASDFPDARPIIVLRDNASWIASQYRRFLKNGYPLTFREFFDIQNDGGIWKIRDATFMPYLQLLEDTFHHKPLVLFYEDMRANLIAFIDRIASYTRTSYAREDISTEPFHVSYSEKQLKVMRTVSKYLFTRNPAYTGSRLNTFIRRRSRMLLCYLILYPAWLIPRRWTGSKALIETSELETIRAYFGEDRAECRAYAMKNNPVP